MVTPAAEMDVQQDCANGERLSLAQKKKLKQKQRKAARRVEREAIEEARKGSTGVPKPGIGEEEGVEIEYVPAPLDLDTLGIKAEAPTDEELMSEAPGLGSMPDVKQEEEGAGIESGADDGFARVLERFGGGGADDEADGEEGQRLETDAADRDEGADGAEAKSDSDEEENGEGEQQLSKKKLRAMSRLKIAELKQACARPDVVEIWDTTAADPMLLVHLKAYRNTVPVPRHWSQKRAYLQGKRGIEKPPFQLPEFIEATGIGEMRQAYMEKAEAQKLKSKGRERMQPKMGKLDIDYQILHDAFFKYQTKPKLTKMGDLYYEGKEYETDVKNAVPGVVSEELREALGMNPGAPPPWLIHMQRYGPPPSYPTLRIPGLNCPIPVGAEFGYHQGGWGKPPVDEEGKPIYGDVFGEHPEEAEGEEIAPVAAVHWGDIELEEDEEESSEEEEEEEEEEDLDALADGTASMASGFASSLPSGIETPSEVDLRKDSAPEPPRQLYTVLEQRAAPSGGGLLAPEHTYAMPSQEGRVSVAAAKRLEALRREVPTDLHVAIDPADLENLSDDALRELYEARVAEARAGSGREDLSDMVAAKAAAQKRKAAEKAARDSKKFKF